MRKYFVLIACVLFGSSLAFAQNTGVDEASRVVSYLIQGLVLLATLGILGHMVYVLFIRKKLRTDWTPEEMSALRTAAGFPAEATAEEDDEVESIIMNQVNSWDTWVDNGEECTLPLHRSNVKNAVAAYEQSVAMMPTTPEVLDDLNHLGDVANEMRKRTFTASKTMLVVLWICVVLISLIGGQWVGPIAMGCVYTALYCMASMKPNYVLIRKELQGKGEKSFLTAIIAGLLGGIAAAPTYRTITKYSDGSTTSEDDNSATWFSIIFTVIVAVFLVFIMPVVSLVNYLRNYVFA